MNLLALRNSRRSMRLPTACRRIFAAGLATGHVVSSGRPSRCRFPQWQLTWGVGLTLAIVSGCGPTNPSSSPSAALSPTDGVSSDMPDDDIHTVGTIASEVNADAPASFSESSQSEGKTMDPSEMTDADWEKRLTSTQYYVTRQHGTERAFTGDYWDHKGEGVYACVCCGHPLFDSQTKYESGTGWPSFYQPLSSESVGTSVDNKQFFSTRTEVHCRRCKAHLGHVFDDGPHPTGLRYCINSASLDFDERAEKP